MTAFSNQARYVMRRLGDCGFEAYAVGGCVRDMCMGKIPHDTDITTNASPQKVLEIFKDDRVIETGLKHGTVTVLKDGEPIEITTYRIDGVYDDNRHPKNVTFTSDLATDLSRRDFTVNAMACDIDGNIVDIFGGRQHIEQKTICCVGDPISRFDEDGLRILRALRFASVLGFTLEKNTAEAVHSRRELLKNISRERIFAEFTKLLCGGFAQNIIETYPDVIAVFVKNYKPCKRPALSLILDDRALRYAAFFADIYTPDEAAAILCDLRSDTKLKARVKAMLKGLDDDISPKEMLKKYGADATSGIIALRYACRPYDRERTKALEAETERIVGSGECYCLAMLDVTGRDLIDAGIPQSGILGDILDMLLDEVMQNKTANQKSTLTDRAVKLYNAQNTPNI